MVVQPLGGLVDSEEVVEVVRIMELREEAEVIQEEVQEPIHSKQGVVEALTAMGVKQLEARVMELPEEIQKMNMDT